MSKYHNMQKIKLHIIHNAKKQNIAHGGGSLVPTLLSHSASHVLGFQIQTFSEFMTLTSSFQPGIYQFYYDT